MATIPPISLPSNPSVKVRLREATVSDAIDFADVNDGMDEAATTMALNQLQEKSSWTEAGSWTGDDRRVALFWYWIHTTEERNPAMKFPCAVCREEHTVAVDLTGIGGSYREIKGKPERDIELEGEKIVVAPLTGKDLEQLELLRLEIIESERENGIGAGSTKVLQARLRLMGVMLSIRFAAEGQEANLELREEKLLKMSTTQMERLIWAVEEKLDDMEHGLESVYHKGQLCLLTPVIPCPESKEGKEGTRLRVPFRNLDHIPVV